jgi:riboflavin synthase
MFTGLIADLGTLVAIERDGESATLSIDTRLASELAPGDSVAVSGVCLTATGVRDGGFTATAIGETLRRSSLGDLEPGAKVNLELALRANDRLGGHIVQGHIDGAGTISEIRREGVARVLAIDCQEARGLQRYLIEKGSIAVDGVSLTVSALRERGFEVSLIPETLDRTTLGSVAVGARVNLEADALAKHVARLMEVPA